MAEVVIDIIGRDNFSSTLGNFGSIMTGIKSTIDLVTGAFNAVAGAVTPFIDSAVESENAITNLEATLRSTGGAVGLTSQQLQDMANGLQQVTKFSDETIINGEAMLLTFTNIGGDIFPQATEAMLNLAEKFGSVDAASVQLGKALNDPINGITALSRVGVSFTEEQKDTIKTMVEMGDVSGAQGVILAELTKEFGGLAEAMGDTFQGKLEILKNRLDEVRETIGTALLPILTQLLDKFIVYLPAIEDFGNRVANVFNAIADSGLFSAETREAILGGIFGVDSLSELFAKADEFIGNVIDAITYAVNVWANGSGPQELSDKIISFIDRIGSGYEIDSKAFNALGNLFNALIRAAGRIDWGAIGVALINDIFDPMEQAGTNAVRNFFNGIEISITDAVRGWFDNIEIDVTGWVREKIVDPIKRFLGIASPSTVFAQIGVNIIQGLLKGIQDSWDTFSDWIMTSLGNLLSNLSWANILKVISGQMSISDLLSDSTAAATPTFPTYSTGGTGTSGTSTGTFSGGSGVVNNFYGPVYFGDMNQLGYGCPSPNPLIAASANSLLTSGVG